MAKAHVFQPSEALLDGRCVRSIAIIGGKVRAEVSSGDNVLYVPIAGIRGVADAAQRELFAEAATHLRAVTA